MNAPAPSSIVSLGEVMLESSVRLDAMPDLNATLIVNAVNRRLGGPALNMAAHLASLGNVVRLGGVVGRWDEAMLRDQLAGVPIDSGSLCWVDGSSDVLFFFKTEQHYSAVYQRAPLPDGLQTQYARLADGAEILLLAGSRHMEIRRVFAQVAATAPARWKVFAPNYALPLFDREELEAILSAVNLVSLNEAEFQGVLCCLGLTDVRELQRISPAAILVTRASDGARLYTAGSVLELPSLSGRAGDVVGAGDAFLAGMLHSLHSGMALVESATCGSRAAASFVRDGAQSLLRNCAELTLKLPATPPA